MSAELVAALGEGDPGRVRLLVEAGADIRYVRTDGYDALIDAVHGRDVARDPRLLDLLKMLIASGARLSGQSRYGESALRVLSRLGRFDAVRLLLDAGADRGHLEWTPLMEAVALGSIEETERALSSDAALEATDHWSRTAFLIALAAGSITKAELLLVHGANRHAVGRCRRPPLFFAIEGHRPEVLRWLVDGGADIDQADEFGATALMQAAEEDDVECLEILLAAGADVDRDAHGTALWRAGTRAIASRLLDAGADPASLSQEGRRSLLGYAPEPDAALLTVSPAEFQRAMTPSFGNHNPERRNEPFWEAMIRSGINAYAAFKKLSDPSTGRPRPIWCAQRFGQSITFLPDGRIVLIGGEHEDHYDPDFCIYNDVLVHTPDGSLAIHGYPEALFAPTDFHTATLVGDHIYVIGRLGYQGQRLFGHTPLHRLHAGTLQMERLETTGEAPGWIYRHRAAEAGRRAIRVWQGKIATTCDGEETHVDNVASFVLDLDRLMWRRQSDP